MDWAKTTARWDENHLSFGIWCVWYQRFYDRFVVNSQEWCLMSIKSLYITSNLIFFFNSLFKPTSNKAWMFHIIDPLWGESTCGWWIPRVMTSSWICINCRDMIHRFDWNSLLPGNFFAFADLIWHWYVIFVVVKSIGILTKGINAEFWGCFVVSLKKLLNSQVVGDLGHKAAYVMPL